MDRGGYRGLALMDREGYSRRTGIERIAHRGRGDMDRGRTV